MLTIDSGQMVAKVSPILHGLMAEEIKCSYDGSLYAELVQNQALLDNPQGASALVAGAEQRGGVGHDAAPPPPLNDRLKTSRELDVNSASQVSSCRQNRNSPCRKNRECAIMHQGDKGLRTG